MAGVGDLLGKIGIGGGGLLPNLGAILVGTIGLGLAGLLVWWFIKKKRNWNIKVEFRIPRNIQEHKQTNEITGTLNKEWGKGYYDAKKGTCFVKRKGKKAVPMKPFDIKRYLSTGNILTVVQIGIEDYRPVLDDSYIELVDSETGEEGALIKAKVDTSESKSWKNSFEREAKMTYSIKNWISEHGGLVAMGLVLMMNLIGFSIVISRMPK